MSINYLLLFKNSGRIDSIESIDKEIKVADELLISILRFLLLFSICSCHQWKLYRVTSLTSDFILNCFFMSVLRCFYSALFVCIHSSNCKRLQIQFNYTSVRKTYIAHFHSTRFNIIFVVFYSGSFCLEQICFKPRFQSDGGEYFAIRTEN